MRDEFKQPTKERIAKRVRYQCSKPDCRCSTIGAAQSHDAIINVGVAAHITAAAPGGARFDPSLSPDERRDQSNGIWLCQTHGKLVDSDSGHFSVEMLRTWKKDAERAAFRAIVSPDKARHRPIESTESDGAEHELIEGLGLEGEEFRSVISRLLGAAQSDLAAFVRMPGWPRQAITLNLRMTDGDSVRAFNVSGLAAAVDTFNEITVIAPPGTGKTTTLLQVTDAILSEGNTIAAFIPLSEWSTRSESLLQTIVRRRAYRDVREPHLALLAHYGRLVLVLDGWNELDTESRKRATAEIKALRREFPRLGLIVSTRRQTLDVPISGPVVEIDMLAEDQQRTIASALRGAQGEVLLDHAWRTPGVRELISIPLYLTVLLAQAPGGSMPTTKEEVLRMFVSEHERVPEKAEALSEALLGFHTELLTGLAVEATRAGNTTISDTQARTVVRQVEDHLFAEGQITTQPQPTAVLNVLVGQHVLVRSGAETEGLSFQHQQFQEWYASFAVEALMRVATTGDEKAARKLRVEVLNIASWEESILFACERVSRANETGVQAVADSILKAIAIDPILAAEMIYRSSADVWDRIEEKIIAFVGRWHTSGKVDRAVHFMIGTGRSEFAPQLWPLISNSDNQVYLRALRAGRRFRPSVLGSDAQARIANLPEHQREQIVSSIAHESGMDGIELSVSLAKADVSPNVQASVVEALHFRRADRFSADILRVAPDEVWRLLARKGYAEEIADPDTAARLRREEQQCLETETAPLTRINALLRAARLGSGSGRQVAAQIEATDFPVLDQGAGWIVDEAHKRFPEEVISALVHRLENNQEIPPSAENLLQAAGVMVDEGRLAELVLQRDGSKRVSRAVVRIAGPRTVGRLIDQLMVVDKNLRNSRGRADEATLEEHHWLSDLIANTSTSAFVEALLDRSSTEETERIVLFADLLARHGRSDDQGPLQLPAEIHERMISTIERWAEIVLVLHPLTVSSLLMSLAPLTDCLPPIWCPRSSGCSKRIWRVGVVLAGNLQPPEPGECRFRRTCTLPIGFSTEAPSWLLATIRLSN